MQQSCTSDFLPVDGCSCAEGLYLNEKGDCVPKAKCPCYHNEAYIKSGKSINIKDEHCVCTNGILHCHSWRTSSSMCTSPKVFFNCSAVAEGELGLQCARTCLNLNNDDCDSTECKSGCRCPNGLLDDGKGSCVKENQCPCQYNRHIYASGSQISKQCNKCTCNSGSWGCTKKDCPGTCTMYGSGHYSTFDEQTYGFHGECAYVAVKSNCGDTTVQQHFGVITENVPCGTTGTTCSKTVRIQLGQMEIKLSKGTYEEVELGRGTEIQYRIRKVGMYWVIESGIGLAVMWDGKTTVRIILEPEHKGQVCGLCGNFDGDGQNDFTTQGQLVVSNPLEFANSWKVSRDCPDVDMNADPCGARPNRHYWAKTMCNIIMGETFHQCRSKVDPRPFYDNCVTDSCACDSGGDCECFCSAVAAYAQACNEASVCVAWRTPEICPVFCDYYNGPGECKWHYNPCHKPCYKTCLNPNGTCTEPLPKLEGCYPVCPDDKPIFDEKTGLCVEQNETFLFCNCTMARCIENNTIEIIPYECPPLQNITCTNGNEPVLVYDNWGCCQHYACDCVCEGWGDPHYITFDGRYYSYQGNCTYVLMEETSPRFNLVIYIDNVYCDPTEDVSCPRSIIISYESEVITLINHNLLGAVELEALKNGERLQLPYYSNHGVKILDTGMNLVYEILRLEVVITFGITGFRVYLPNQHFGGNTQGHCGTCTNDQRDDCKLPGGQLVDNCAVMADYWPANHIDQPNCHAPSVVPTSVPEPPPIITPCQPDSLCPLLRSGLFAACHPYVSPENVYLGCVFDNCHISNPAVECTSLQTYAAACAQAGVCLHWRNHTKLCASDCPSNKVYKPCGPAEQPTCEDNPNEPTMNYTTEGCFCPDGMKLFNKESGICVDKCGCLDPEGIPREFDEEFVYKCQNCICKESTKTVTCKPKTCPAPPIISCTEPGFVLVNQTNPSDPCCSTFVCQCHRDTCPPIEKKCEVGYETEDNVPEGKCCPEHTCVPKRVCVHKDIEYRPGSPVPAPPCQDCICTNEVDPNTGLFKKRCEFQTCNKNCDLGYEYQETDFNECCGKCVQTHCVASVNGTDKLLKPGDTWSPPENKCLHYTCIKVGNTLTAFNSHIVCPPFHQSNCQPGTIQTSANGCCKICVEKEKGCKRVPMKTHIKQGSCQSYNEVDLPYCEGTCNTFTMYSEAAAAMLHSCSCCRETRSSSRTVDLHCLNGDVVPCTYIHVEECGCSHSDCTRPAVKPARRRRSSTLV